MHVYGPDIIGELGQLRDAARGGLTLVRAWTRSEDELSLEYVDRSGRALHGVWTRTSRVDATGGEGAGGGVVRFLGGIADERLPVFSMLAATPGATLVSHRPGRRAVFRLEREGRCFFARAVRPRKAPALLATLDWAASLNLPALAHAATVERDEARGFFMTHEVPGTEMHALAQRCPLRYIGAARSLGAALRAFHRQTPAWMPPHTAADESRLLERKAAELQHFVPEVATLAASLIPAVTGRLSAKERPSVAVHRDLYDRQVIVSDDDLLSIIDLDTLCAGEAALDLGNVVAHFELRSELEPHLARVMRRASAVFLNSYGPSTADLDRAAAYADATRLRLAMLFALRPAGRHISPRMLARVGRLGFLREPSARTPIRDTARPIDPVFFIVGCPRSGTTLFERMFDARADLVMAHETHWITRIGKRFSLSGREPVTPSLLRAVYEDPRFVRVAPSRRIAEGWLESGPLDFASFVERVFGSYREAFGVSLVGDKSTGGYVRRPDLLRRYCPGARLLHLVRDGRDVCLSMLGWPKAGRAAGRFRTWPDEPVATSAAWWRWQVLSAIARGRPLGTDAYREIRYEELVDEPERVCRESCSFVGIPFDAAMVGFASGRTDPTPGLSANRAWMPPTRGIRDWRRDMPARDIELFEAIAGDALDCLGYARRFPEPDPGVTARAGGFIKHWIAEAGDRAWPRPQTGSAALSHHHTIAGEEP